MKYKNIEQLTKQKQRYYTPSQTLQLAEWHVYGSSRVGIYKAYKALVKIIDETITTISYQTRVKFCYNGKKQYELSNHLGNVLVTISDRRKAICNEVGSTLSYSAVVVTATDYYSFGSPMVGRTYEGDTSLRYRYGFNGKEKDSESDLQDYGMRIYNPMIGKFLSVDPLVKDYPWYTPYQFAGNKPIIAVDVDGNEEFIVIVKPISNIVDCKIEISNVYKLDPLERTYNAAMGTGGVEYRYYDDNGNLTSSERLQDFKPNTAESEYLNQTVTFYTDLLCKSTEQNDLRRNVMVPVSISQIGLNSPIGIPSTNLDGTINSESSKYVSPGKRFSGAINLVNAMLNINFIPDKSKITKDCLSNFEKAMKSIYSFINYLNEKDSITNDKTIIITGSYDINPSNYKNGCGNKCLANDRAKNLAQKIKSLLIKNINIISKGIENKSSTVNNDDRNAKALVIPSN